MNFRFARFFAAALFFGSIANAQTAPIVKKNIDVKMRDGIVLRADILLPSPEGKFPVLVYRTPYGKDNAPREWTTFDKAAARGYAVVAFPIPARCNGWLRSKIHRT